MFRVYRVTIDQAHFRTLRFKDEAAFMQLYPKPFIGLPMLADASDTRPEIELIYEHRERPAATFSYLMPGALVVSFEGSGATNETNVLSQAVLTSGEVWPVNVEGVQQFMINVHVANALNHSRAEVVRDSQGHVTDIKKYVFHKERLSHSLFKLPETVATEMFTFTGGLEPREDWVDDELFLGYQADGLTGLDFELVWEDES